LSTPPAHCNRAMLARVGFIMYRLHRIVTPPACKTILMADVYIYIFSRINTYAAILTFCVMCVVSGGAIAGIVFAAIVGVVVLILLLRYVASVRGASKNTFSSEDVYEDQPKAVPYGGAYDAIQ
jgi:energy-coupling factor transporter transmembrane protein EcfT